LKSGKDTLESIDQRLVRSLHQRSERTVIWWHGASVGECTLLLETAKQFAQLHGEVQFLFTCQTLTARDLILNEVATDQILQESMSVQAMAPLDFNSTTLKFIEHWQPSLYVGAEGEIWPHTLGNLKRSEISCVLINARMTEKSLIRWSRWPATSKSVFGNFVSIVAGDKKTASGLSEILNREISSIGNLKSALPPPPLDLEAYKLLSELLRNRRIFVAASTHPGEEVIVIDALMQLEDRPFTIFVPRHTKRAQDIEALLEMSGLTFSIRSDHALPDVSEDAYLADTMGEMGLWLQLADEVYLGGGHCPGVGGHNPIEPLQYNKPVITGPSLFNFDDLAKELVKHNGFKIVEDAEAIRDALPLAPPSDALISALETGNNSPMLRTLDALNTAYALAKDKQ